MDFEGENIGKDSRQKTDFEGAPRKIPYNVKMCSQASLNNHPKIRSPWSLHESMWL